MHTHTLTLTLTQKYTLIPTHVQDVLVWEAMLSVPWQAQFTNAYTHTHTYTLARTKLHTHSGCADMGSNALCALASAVHVQIRRSGGGGQRH
jgi:hypothetical protein